MHYYLLFALFSSCYLSFGSSQTIRYGEEKLSVEIIDIIKNSTIFIESYKEAKHYYYGHPRIFMIVKAQGQRDHILTIPEYNATYAISVYPRRVHCVRSNMQLNFPVVESTVPWHYFTRDPSTREYLVGPFALLNYITSSESWEQQGYKLVNGVNCTHKYAQDSYTKMHLYTAYNTDGKAGYSAGDPVRLILQGTFQIGGYIPSESKIHFQYTFMPAVPLTDMDKTYFQLPIGWQCAGLTNKQALIDVNNGFRFYADAEILWSSEKLVNGSYETVSSLFMEYSKAENYFSLSSTKFRFSTYYNRTMPYGRSVKTTLLNYGLQYQMYLGCTISKTTVTNVEFNLPDGSVLSWPSPSEVLNFTGANYLGTAMKNKILCNVYEKTVHNYLGVSKGGASAPKAVLTLLETADKVQVKTEVGVKYNIPITLEIRLFSSVSSIYPSKLVVINFGWFHSLSGSYLEVEDSSYYLLCTNRYKSDQQFQITYEGIDASKNEDQLRRLVSNAVVRTGKTNALMVSPAHIILTESGFIASLRIRSRPSPVLEFTTPQKNKVISETTGLQAVTQPMLYEEDCAKACLLSQNGLCTFYSYCDFSCYLYNGKKSSPSVKTVVTADICWTRKRISDTFTKSNLMPFISQIVSSVQQTILLESEPNTGNTNFDDKARNDDPDPVHSMDVIANPLSKTDKITYVPKSCSSNLPEYRQLTSKRKSLQGLGFRMAKRRTVLKVTSGSTRSFDHLNPYSCQKSCLEEGEFYCNSFSVCYNKKTCLISTLESTDLNATTTASEIDCFIYTRQHLSEYEQVPGVVIKTQGTSVPSAHSASDCASTCSSKKSCESFDFCYGHKSCTLHKQHAVSVKSSSDLQHVKHCFHYSRIYRLDYKHSANKAMPSTMIGEQFTDKTADACAKECSQSDTCVSFDYCENGKSRVCKLSGSVADHKNNKLLVNNACAHYESMTAKYKMKSTSGPSNPKSSKSSSNHTVSKGAAAGIAIVMIFVGAGIAAVGLFIYKKRQINY